MSVGIKGLHFNFPDFTGPMVEPKKCWEYWHSCIAEHFLKTSFVYKFKVLVDSTNGMFY